MYNNSYDTALLVNYVIKVDVERLHFVVAAGDLWMFHLSSCLHRSHHVVLAVGVIKLSCVQI